MCDPKLRDPRVAEETKVTSGRTWFYDKNAQAQRDFLAWSKGKKKADLQKDVLNSRLCLNAAMSIELRIGSPAVAAAYADVEEVDVDDAVGLTPAVRSTFVTYEPVCFARVPESEVKAAKLLSKAKDACGSWSQYRLLCNSQEVTAYFQQGNCYGYQHDNSLADQPSFDFVYIDPPYGFGKEDYDKEAFTPSMVSIFLSLCKIHISFCNITTHLSADAGDLHGVAPPSQANVYVGRVVHRGAGHRLHVRLHAQPPP